MNETPAYSKSQKRISELRNHRIAHAMLCGMLLKFQEGRIKNPNSRVPTELAEVFLVFIEKILGAANWRGYSDDWKEEFRGLATIHLCKYSVRFNASKCTDAVNYFYKMISNAFKQALKSTRPAMKTSVGTTILKWDTALRKSLHIFPIISDHCPLG